MGAWSSIQMLGLVVFLGWLLIWALFYSIRDLGLEYGIIPLDEFYPSPK